MSNQIQLRERALYSYCARSWRQQTNQISKPSGWKCYKTVSCAFIKIWSTWEVWRALKNVSLNLDLSSFHFFQVVTYWTQRWHTKASKSSSTVSFCFPLFEDIVCYLFVKFVKEKVRFTWEKARNYLKLAEPAKNAAIMLADRWPLTGFFVII